MRSDRKLNKFIMIASVLGIIAGVILLVSGLALGGIGYFKPVWLDKVKDITNFINQQWLTTIQTKLFNALLKIEFLYLFVGLAIALIGVLTLTIALVTKSYAKNVKVVRRRLPILLFNVLPLAISAGGVYVLLRLGVFTDKFKKLTNGFEAFTDNMIYVVYGITAIFGLIAIFNILGVLFSRSEKFMSNDNNKYAFDNSSVKNARREVNNNVRDAQYVQPQQNAIQSQQHMPQTQQYAQRPANPQTRPVNAQNQMRAPQPRPQGAMPARPAQPPRQQNGVPSRPGQLRPQINTNAQSTARPVASMNGAVPSRPAMHTSQRPINAGPRPSNNVYCVKCGKMLKPGETICTLCGTRAVR